MDAKQPTSDPRLTLPPRTLHLEQWRIELSSCPDTERVLRVLNVIQHGAKLQYEGPLPTRHSRNLASAFAHPDVVSDYIRTETTAGRLAGPFVRTCLPFPVVVSPLGIVQKTRLDGTVKYRTIHHLSYPHGGISVNSGLEGSKRPLSYGSFDNAIDDILHFGPGALFFKLDVKSAFRHIFVHPDSWFLLAFEWEGLIYLEKCLPFGMSLSPQIWDDVSVLLRWILLRKASLRLLPVRLTHFVDDFNGTTKPNKKIAARILRLFLATGPPLGVVWELSKTEGPHTKGTFMGLGLDSARMVTDIPSDKLAKAVQLVTTWLAPGWKANLLLGQQLMGFLAFVGRVIRNSRLFSQRLLQWLREDRPTHKGPVPPAALSDLRWWSLYLPLAASAVPMTTSTWTSSTFVIRADASTSWGGGAWLDYGQGSSSFQPLWFNKAWSTADRLLSRRTSAESINYYELLTLLLSVCTWASTIQHNKLVVLTDSSTATAVLSSGSSHCPHLSSLARLMWVAATTHNIELRVFHIPRELNSEADLLSKNDSNGFLRAVPTASRQPSVIGTLPRELFLD